MPEIYAPGMATSQFTYAHRVTYADCTLGNHIYYGRYLDLLEAARGDFFRELGVSFRVFQEQGIIFPVIECRLRYRSPARYDDSLAISVWPATLERVRLNFGYRIADTGGRTVLEGETFHACTDLNEKPRRIPVELVERLTPYLPAAALRA